MPEEAKLVDLPTEKNEAQMRGPEVLDRIGLRPKNWLHWLLASLPGSIGQTTLFALGVSRLQVGEKDSEWGGSLNFKSIRRQKLHGSFNLDSFLFENIIIIIFT